MSLKKSSRRVFLREGATLAAATAAGITAASGQGFSQDPKLRTDFVPEDQVPKDHVWRDPWTGEMMRDEEGNLVVDWTGTPQWERYRKNAQEMGKGYGTLEVDSRLYGVRSRFVKKLSPRPRWRLRFWIFGNAHGAQRQQDVLLFLAHSRRDATRCNNPKWAALR